MGSFYSPQKAFRDKGDTQVYSKYDSRDKQVQISLDVVLAQHVWDGAGGLWFSGANNPTLGRPQSN